MTSPRWARVEELFHAALERSPAERDAFVDETCGGDERLRREVLSLLAQEKDAERLMEEPAAAAATRKVAVTRGTRLGPYEVVDLLGAGGMGEVYRARDARLGREVAIKVLPDEIASDPDLLRRFEQEARAIAALDDPHILTIHDVGTEAGVPYVVTELLEGETLREVLGRREPDRAQIFSFAVHLAQGLAAAHRKGIVHRDLKPENVFVTVDGRVKILDFGLAKRIPAGGAGDRSTAPSGATGPGTVMGTGAYMSPEQVRALAVDARSDVFSFGVVLYELLSRRHPFRRETEAATLAAVLQESPPLLTSLDPTIPKGIEGIVARCLDKRREERFRDGHDVAVALDAVLQAPSGRAALADLEERSPYPGLASFTEKDGAVFFGREAEVRELWDKIRQRRLLAVIGPSGAGKTSFVRAGLVPARPEGWRAVVCTPGRAPMRALARALAPELASDPEALRRLPDFEEPEVPEELLSRWRRAHSGVLVVVDQLEELFTLNPEPVQTAFARLLGRFSSEGGVHVLLSLRDDFLLHTQAHEPLKPVLAELSALLPLSGDGLRRAVLEPARRRGYRFEDPALVGEMVSAVEGVRGGLPLLAFAVARLWEKRDREGKRLTRAVYQEIGGVTGALARHAEATLERLGSQGQAVVREIFRNLVTAHGTRGALDREELLSAFPEREPAGEVLCHLVDARLLTSYEVPGRAGEPGHHRLEIVHESLLAAWPRLVRWQAQDEEGALLRDQLRQAAHAWQERGRTRDLLWTGTAYREFELWRERYPGALTALEEEFGRAMAERARRKRRLARAAAIAVFLAAAGVAIAIGLSQRQAMRARDEAQAEARHAEASTLVGLGRAELDRHPAASLAFARRSLEVADTPAGRRLVVDALWRSPTARVLSLGSEVVWRAAFSPDGRWLAGHSFEGKLVLVSEEGGPARVLPGLTRTSFPGLAVFAPIGQSVLAMAREDAFVRLLDVADGREIRRFEPSRPTGPENAFRGRPDYYFPLRWAALPRGLLFWWVPAEGFPKERVPFGVWPYDGGSAIVTGSWPAGTLGAADHEGSRLLVRRGPRLLLRPLFGGDDTVERPVATLGASGRVQGYGFVPSGDRVWLADVQEGLGRLRVWPIDRGPTEPQVFSLRSFDNEFSPVWDSAGSRVAWGSSAAHVVSVWDLADPPDAYPTLLRRPDMSLTKSAAFAPGRDWLAVLHQGVLTSWALGQPRVRVFPGHPEAVSRLIFTHDSASLISCAMDELRLWPLRAAEGGVQRIASDFRGSCRDVALAPDGEGLVPVGSEGAWLAPTFHGRGRWLWGGPDELTEPTHALIGAAAWDPSGRRLAVATRYTTRPDNLVRVFDVAVGHERTLALTPPGEPGGGYDWGATRLAFTPDGRLLVGGSGGVRWLDARTGGSDWISCLPREVDALMAMSSDGRWLLTTVRPRDSKTARDRGAVRIDLASGGLQPVLSHGSLVTAVGIDAAGRAVVTGDGEGVVRVGPADGGEPHRLCCHAGAVATVAVSPDGRWVASASGGEIRLWPMPDVAKPPLHTLRREALLAKLDELTNVRVVEDTTSATGYRLDPGPFPGWKDAPTW